MEIMQTKEKDEHHMKITEGERGTPPGERGTPHRNYKEEQQ